MSSNSQLAGSNSSSSGMALNLLGNAESLTKIKDLLPGDNSARTDLLLNLLKSSYNSSLHTADVRLASLTQEVASLRAQNTYLESKLRSVESLAEAAGRSTEEQKKRAELLAQENVRVKAENQQLKGENEQLNNFKAILLSAANGMTNQGLAATTAAAIMSGSSAGGALPSVQRFAGADAHALNPMLSTADLDYKSNASMSAHANNPSAGAFFFSPLKRPVESIGISHLQPSQTPSNSHFHAPPASQSTNVAAGGASHQTPFVRRSPAAVAGSYVHVMPSPLSADALASPAPPTHSNKTVPAGADILQEINANLSSSRPRPSSSPVRAANPNSYASSSASLPSFTLPTHTATSSSVAPALSSSHLVDQARALFHAAQSKLPSHTFSEFVSLVQQFRSIGSNSMASENAWQDIRMQAASLLAQHSDLFVMFEQLLQATRTAQ